MTLSNREEDNRRMKGGYSIHKGNKDKTEKQHKAKKNNIRHKYEESNHHDGGHPEYNWNRGATSPQHNRKNTRVLQQGKVPTHHCQRIL
jgi:hypothetical protein